MFINSRTAITVAIISLLLVFYNLKNSKFFGALSFLHFKDFELYWGSVFFLKILSHIFMIFEVKLG